MNKKVILGTALLMLGFSVVFAQETTSEEKVNELEEVVISDSKFSLKREQSGKVIAVISSEDLKRSQGESVATVLNRVSGIEINGSKSAAGQSLGYFIRGGRNRQVVIRVDGVTVSDPSTIAGEFDLRLLSTNQIEKIEILKGASSTLYGSGAATAVINITSKKESKEKIAASFSSTLGTNQSQEDQDYNINEFVNLASIHGTLGKINYLTSFSNHFADGLSAVEKLPDNTSETEFAKDAYSKFNVSTTLGYRWNTNFKFHIFGNLDQYSNNFDQAGGVDGEQRGDSRQLRGGSYWDYKYPKGNVVFVHNYALLKRNFYTNYPSESNSRTHTFDLYAKHTFTEYLFGAVGVNGTNNDYNNYSASGKGMPLRQKIYDHEADFDILDPYINMVYASKIGLNLNAGIRLNIHSEYGTHFVYNVNPSYTFKFGEHYIKGLASYSTAYITPSLFQLYSPNYGNVALTPEENITIEGGLELSINKKSRISVVYFSRKEENFVDFVDQGNYVYQYVNTNDDFQTGGVEVEVTSRVLDDKLSLSGNVTYTKMDEELSLVRIPEIKVNATVGYQITDKTFSSLSYQFNGEREDSFFNGATFQSEKKELASYGLLDFYFSQQVSKIVSVYATLTNITNEEYQELYGYSTRGRNVKVGFNLRF